MFHPCSVVVVVVVTMGVVGCSRRMGYTGGIIEYIYTNIGRKTASSSLGYRMSARNILNCSAGVNDRSVLTSPVQCFVFL